MRFLIVSTDDLLRSRLAEDLRARSFAVDEAENTISAESAPPDRVVVDVTRASAPGKAMLGIVRETATAYPEASIVVLAPYPSAELMRMALRLGARHCVARTESGAAVLAAFEDAERPIDLTPRAETTFATLDEARWQHIGRALETSRGNISGAARLLGIHRQSLQRILRSLKSNEQPASDMDNGYSSDA